MGPTKEAQIAYMEKELKKTRMSIKQALRRPNVTDAELNSLLTREVVQESILEVVRGARRK